MKKCLLTIAGYDPSGGAGALLDVAVFERLGFRGVGVLTAVAAQNPGRVGPVYRLKARLVLQQFKRLENWTPFAGVKVGMLGTLENMEAVARLLGRRPRVPRVVDPVFRSSSGARLLHPAARRRFLDAFEMRADLITPNLEEAEVLSGRPVLAVEEMELAAEQIWKRSGLPCLVKGGHLEGRAVDVLFDGKELTRFTHGRAAKSVHGTGCFLSSAILAYLADGRPLKEACGLGISMVGKAIRGARPAGPGRWVFDVNRAEIRERAKERARP